MTMVTGSIACLSVAMLMNHDDVRASRGHAGRQRGERRDAGASGVLETRFGGRSAIQSDKITSVFGGARRTVQISSTDTDRTRVHEVLRSVRRSKYGGPVRAA